MLIKNSSVEKEINEKYVGAIQENLVSIAKDYFECIGIDLSSVVGELEKAAELYRENYIDILVQEYKNTEANVLGYRGNSEATFFAILKATDFDIEQINKESDFSKIGLAICFIQYIAIRTRIDGAAFIDELKMFAEAYTINYYQTDITLNVKMLIAILSNFD